MTTDIQQRIPRLLLSGRPLSGQAAVPRDQNLAALARFSAPAAVRDFLADGAKAGYGGIFTLGSSNVISALRQTRSSSAGSFSVLPIIPNVPDYVREATEYGMAGAGLRRLGRVGLMGFVRAGLVGATHPFRVLRKDFTTLMSILFELEMAEFSRFSPPAAFLHPTMTDLELSFGNRAFFANFANFMRRRYGVEPGLVTSNFVNLAAKLTEWDIPISIIAAPLNREGYLMRGGLEGYRRALDTGRFSLIADRIAPESPPSSETIDWALSQKGVISAVVETQAQIV